MYYWAPFTRTFTSHLPLIPNNLSLTHCRLLGASALVTIIQVCTDFIASGGQPHPHVVILTEEMGCRSVSWRSLGG